MKWFLDECWTERDEPVQVEQNLVVDFLEFVGVRKVGFEGKEGEVEEKWREATVE